MNAKGIDRLIYRFEKAAAGVIYVPVLVLLLSVTLCALTQTAVLSTADISGEHIELVRDRLSVNLLCLFVMLCVLFIFYRYGKRLSVRKVECCMLCICLVLGTLFILTTKLRAPDFSDSFILTYTAQRSAVGDISMLGESYYLRFPFQLGYVLYCELFFRAAYLLSPDIPEGYVCLVLQEMNLLWLLFTYHSLLCTSVRMGASGQAQKLTAVLLPFCLPALLSCTFLYGLIPALGCGAGAVWMFTEHLRDRGIKYALLCALFLSAAVILKLNMLIFLVAIAGIWLIECAKKRSLRSFVCLAVTAALVLSVRTAPQKLYSERTGLCFGDGIPMTAWLAMGLSEGYAAPGWYREDNTVAYFTESGNDPAATDIHAKQVICERLAFFSEDGREALRFFGAKLASQWNEPTCGSLWLNQVYGSYGEKGSPYSLLCEKAAGFTAGLMAQYQQLVLFAALIGIPVLWKKRDIGCAVLPLIILGGLMYHLLFEAKSQYALPYFVLMLPLAGYGLAELFGRFDAQ